MRGASKYPYIALILLVFFLGLVAVFQTIPEDKRAEIADKIVEAIVEIAT